MPLDPQRLADALVRFNNEPDVHRYTEMLSEQDQIVRTFLAVSMGKELFNLIETQASSNEGLGIQLDLSQIVDAVVLRTIANIRLVELEEYEANATAKRKPQ